MLRPGLIALLCALTVGAAGLLVPAVGGAAAVAPHGAPAATIADLPRPVGPRVLLLFLPAREKPAKVPPTVKNPPNPQEIVQKRIDDRKQLSIGLIGATQGPYTQEQFLLDLTSGTRTSTATYDTNHPWPMRLSVAGTADLGHDSRVVGLYRVLGWLTTVVLCDQALDKPSCELEFSKKAAKIADDLRDVITRLVKLKEPITESQEEKDRTVPTFASRPVHLKTCAKLEAAVVKLVELVA